MCRIWWEFFDTISLLQQITFHLFSGWVNRDYFRIWSSRNSFVFSRRNQFNSILSCIVIVEVLQYWISIFLLICFWIFNRSNWSSDQLEILNKCLQWLFQMNNQKLNYQLVVTEILDNFVPYSSWVFDGSSYSINTKFFTRP